MTKRLSVIVLAVGVGLITTQVQAADAGTCWTNYLKAKNAAKNDDAQIVKADKAYDACVATAKPICKRGGVRLGMAADDVKCIGWGKPNHVNRTINAYGTTEQWVYMTAVIFTSTTAY